jgi:preprotein translocase subunit SecE
VAEKVVKTKQPEAEKPKAVAQKPRVAVDRGDKPKQPNALARWWRETLGELRKVSWPSRQDAQRLTLIVLAVMAAMGALLGILDWVFSRLIALLVA